MSRLGKIPVNLPKEAKLFQENGSIRVEGSKGKLSLPIPEGIKIESEEDQIVIVRESDTKQARSNHGTIRALLVNMIEGVTKGHVKDLEVQGLGFRVQMQGEKMIGNLGLSHQVEFSVPKGIKLSTPKPTEIKVEGIDKTLVGQVAANIRALKPAEPYKGKGIRYVGEVVRRKQGKTVSK